MLFYKSIIINKTLNITKNTIADDKFFISSKSFIVLHVKIV